LLEGLTTVERGQLAALLARLVSVVGAHAKADAGDPVTP
jgi:hypothetical protein